MKTIKFLRNVAVYAVHREAGSVHQIEDKDALQLIADRAAVMVEVEKQTAEAPHSEKESATLPHPEKGRKMKH